VYRPLRFVLAPIVLLAAAIAQQTPVSVEQEPYHHVVLKNDDVIVLRVVLPPGDTTGYHIHSCDRTGVMLSQNTTAGQKWGEDEAKPTDYRAGDVFSDSCNGQPLTHRVHNVGQTPMEVIDLELKHRPTVPSNDVAGPVVMENPSVRVYKWVIAPGKTTAMHTHTRPYLIVSVTPMQLTMTAPDGESRTEQVKAGEFHWVPVSVTHSLANGSSTEAQIVEFELK
jgi:quercetin dioxygenase-like cupin family protein